MGLYLLVEKRLRGQRLGDVGLNVDENIGVGFVGFGQTSKKLWLFKKSGPSCLTEEKK